MRTTVSSWFTSSAETLAEYSIVAVENRREPCPTLPGVDISQRTACFRGLRKVLTQAVLTALVVNVKRMVKLLSQVSGATSAFGVAPSLRRPEKRKVRGSPNRLIGLGDRSRRRWEVFMNPP